MGRWRQLVALVLCTISVPSFLMVLAAGYYPERVVQVAIVCVDSTYPSI